MANEWTYRDRLCNVSYSMYGSEPVEIMKLTQALNLIVKDLGETSLSDPILWQVLRGKNYNDRMIESAVRHVQDGLRMKCISRANELKEREERAQTDRARRQHEFANTIVNRFGHSDDALDAARYACEGLKYGIDWGMEKHRDDIILKMKSLGLDMYRRRDGSDREKARVIALIKEQMRGIVRDLGIDALGDPALKKAFGESGADYDDYLEAARQVRREESEKILADNVKRIQGGVGRHVYVSDNPWMFVIDNRQLEKGDIILDTQTNREYLFTGNGRLEEIAKVGNEKVTESVKRIEQIIGTMEGASSEEISRKLNEMISGDKNLSECMEIRKTPEETSDVIERLDSMGVTFTSPDESVNILVEKLTEEHPKKDEERWKRKRIVKEEGHFENLRNTKYGREGKKGSLWSRIKGALCGSN